MSSSATGVGMPICFLGAILLILTQKSSQKFGDVLGIMSRGTERKWQRTVFSLSAMLAKKQRTAPNQKDCPLFINRFFLFLGR